mmetsp:Transcript_69391/g.160777  ORF Transcript_69391/g.160777 Transcript_69391/m.160777 type:complete len:290 (-) Transcript_69391:31-900(-)
MAPAISTSHPKVHVDAVLALIALGSAIVHPLGVASPDSPAGAVVLAGAMRQVVAFWGVSSNDGQLLVDGDEVPVVRVKGAGCGKPAQIRAARDPEREELTIPAVVALVRAVLNSPRASLPAHVDVTVVLAEVVREVVARWSSRRHRRRLRVDHDGLVLLCQVVAVNTEPAPIRATCSPEAHVLATLSRIAPGNTISFIVGVVLIQHAFLIAITLARARNIVVAGRRHELVLQEDQAFCRSRQWEHNVLFRLLRVDPIFLVPRSALLLHDLAIGHRIEDCGAGDTAQNEQ